MDEKRLIEKAKEGHNMSMNFLLEDNYKILYGFMVKLTGDQELAKDMTQEAMLKAVINIRKFRGDSKFSSWLIRIGINHYKNYTKKHKFTTELLDINMVSTFNVEDDILKKEKLKRLYNSLRKVKPKDRTIFILKYYEGYDYQEISDMTGIKVGTCKSKMHYLISKLRLEMEDL